jgi:hypothetical protein
MLPEPAASSPALPARANSGDRGAAQGARAWPAATLLVGLVVATVVAAAPPEATQRLGGLDCSRVAAQDVREVLNHYPAPRVIALEGSVPIVNMAPFAAFLEAMGYPRERLADPVDGRTSYVSFVDSRRLAGQVAWHYEREGLMPILIGHSQGGMVVIKVLHELAGTYGAPIPVWNPARGEPEPRTTIRDPATGQERAVLGLKVDFAAALATGSLPRYLLGQWDIVPLLREVPDSAIEFTGFQIPWDLIAGNGPDPAGFRAVGTARVRNVILPAGYSHIGLPRTEHLAAQPATRAWIDRYQPGDPVPALADADLDNIVHAAELWHSVKKHWCQGAQRLTRVRVAAAMQ